MVTVVGNWWLGVVKTMLASRSGSVKRDALFIDRDQRHVARFQPEDVAHVGIARLFHRHAGVGTDQQAGQQVKRILRAQRDEDFVVAGHDAAARQDAAADLLDQQRIVMGPGIVGPGAQPFLAQRLPGAVAPFGQRKEIVVHLAVDEGIGVALPVQRLGDVLLRGRILDEAGRPVDLAGGPRCSRRGAAA